MLQAILLGIVQGLTEFLPISSSAHLIIIPALLKWKDLGLTFDLALHMGTLIAVIIYFRKLLLDVVIAFFYSIIRKKEKLFEQRLAWFIIISTIPGAILGKLFEHKIETVLRSPFIAAGLLIIFAFVLMLADIYSNKERKLEDITLIDAVIIGLSQALALMPGVSRSGITISAALFLGLTRQSAAEYSFLMALPIIAGGGLFKMIKVVKTGLSSSEALILVIGIISSAVTGYFCIKYFLQYLQKHSFRAFIYYRWVLGICIIGYFLLAGR